MQHYISRQFPRYRVRIFLLIYLITILHLDFDVKSASQTYVQNLISVQKLVPSSVTSFQQILFLSLGQKALESSLIIFFIHFMHVIQWNLWLLLSQYIHSMSDGSSLLPLLLPKSKSPSPLTLIIRSMFSSVLIACLQICLSQYTLHYQNDPLKI